MTWFFDGTPNEVLIELEQTPGVWTEIGDLYVLRNTIRFEVPTTQKPKKLSFTARDTAGDLTVLELQRVRAKVNGLYVIAGEIQLRGTKTWGNSQDYALTIVDDTTLLEAGSKQIEEEVVIPPGQSDLIVLRGGAFAVPVWQASRKYIIGDYCQPNPVNLAYYKVTDIRNPDQDGQGTSGSTQPPFSTTPLSTVDDGNLVWTCMGSTVWGGVMPLYCPEISADGVDTIITGLPELILKDMSPRDVILLLSKYQAGSQNFDYYVGTDPVTGASVLYTIDWNNPAFVPFAEKEFVDHPPTSSTEVGWKSFSRTRQGKVINAQTVKGPNGARGEIDGSISPEKEWTPNTTTNRLVCNAHGFQNGDIVFVRNNTGEHNLPNPLREYENGLRKAYYVAGVQPNTFYLTYVPGGNQITFKSSGGSGNHFVVDARYDQFAHQSYLAYGNKRKRGKVIKLNDPEYGTNEACREYARGKVWNWYAGRDTIDITSDEMIDPNILVVPMKFKVTNTSSGESLDQAAYACGNKVVALNEQGIASWTYQGGDRYEREGDTETIGLRLGQPFPKDNRAPARPVLYEVANNWDGKQRGVIVQVGFNIPYDRDYKFSQIKWTTEDGGTILGESSLLHKPARDFVIPRVFQRGDRFKVFIRSEDTNGNSLGYGDHGILLVATTVTDLQPPASVAVRSGAFSGEGWDWYSYGAGGMAYVDVVAPSGGTVPDFAQARWFPTVAGTGYNIHGNWPEEVLGTQLGQGQAFLGGTLAMLLAHMTPGVQYTVEARCGLYDYDAQGRVIDTVYSNVTTTTITIPMPEAPTSVVVTTSMTETSGAVEGQVSWGLEAGEPPPGTYRVDYWKESAPANVKSVWTGTFNGGGVIRTARFGPLELGAVSYKLKVYALVWPGGSPANIVGTATVEQVFSSVAYPTPEAPAAPVPDDANGEFDGVTGKTKFIFNAKVSPSGSSIVSSHTLFVFDNEGVQSFNYETQETEITVWVAAGSAVQAHSIAWSKWGTPSADPNSFSGTAAARPAPEAPGTPNYATYAINRLSADGRIATVGILFEKSSTKEITRHEMLSTWMVSPEGRVTEDAIIPLVVYEDDDTHMIGEFEVQPGTKVTISAVRGWDIYDTPSAWSTPAGTEYIEAASAAHDFPSNLTADRPDPNDPDGAMYWQRSNSASGEAITRSDANGGRYWHISPGATSPQITLRAWRAAVGHQYELRIREWVDNPATETGNYDLLIPQWNTWEHYIVEEGGDANALDYLATEHIVTTGTPIERVYYVIPQYPYIAIQAIGRTGPFNLDFTSWRYMEGIGQPGALPTASKEVVGAIGEVHDTVFGLDTRVSDLEAAGGSGGIGAILAGGSRIGVNVGGGATGYNTFAFLGDSAAASGSRFTAAESERQILIPVGGTLKNFYVRSNNVQPGDGADVLTVRVNGVDTGITITIPAGAAAGTFSDTTHTAAVAAGDLLSFKSANAAASTAAVLMQWSILIA